MKVGIYTAHIIHNYGAQLQAYASIKFISGIINGKVELVNVITSHEAKGLKYYLKKIIPSHIIRSFRFNKFHKQLPHSSTFTSQQLFESPLHYDLHVVGSDQVWNVSNGMRKYPVYFLPFVKNEPKISLASSFGVAEIPNNVKNDVKKFLSDFTSLSVREADGIKILAELGLNAKLIMDPTFWLRTKDWEQLAGEKPIIKGDYIVAYGFEHKNPNVQQLIDTVHEIYSMPVLGFDAAHNFHYQKAYNSGGPIEFLNIIRFAKAVITGSFHGTAFSIIFKKNFFVLPHSTRNSRINNILNIIGLTNQMLVNPESFSTEIIRHRNIDYSRVDTILSKLQNETREYIADAIKNSVL